ncbi:MAG: rod shape-determining protein MreC [Candidatus Pacebacteria bacterium]|nr:rod shape-determining protein MreC [Candidatus Paceibacterota bacterium]
MSYLLDKKKKNKKITNILLVAFAVLLIVYFNKGIFSGLSQASHFVFKPFVSLGNSIKTKISNSGAYFYSKKFLLLENERLQNQINSLNANLINHNTLEDENSKLKEVLNRKNESKELTLAYILSKPNHSAYDVLILDIGEDGGIREGSVVFAHGDIPIGKISEVYPNSSKVILFSTPGEKTEVVITGKDTFMEMVGRGGGNFEMILPRDFVLESGTNVHLPGVNSYIVATAETIISDPRDAFLKALLVSPINIQELKFVEVEK